MKDKLISKGILAISFLITPLLVVNSQQNSRATIGSLLSNQTSTKTKLLATQKSRTNVLENSIPTKGKRSPFRAIDGTNNNLSSNKRDWGSANSIFRRVLPASYGSEDPTGALNDTDRPSPRAISNLLSDEPITIFTERELSALGYAWGQFLDHDITLTPTGDEYSPIALPEDETIFTIDIPFNRSNYVIINNQREHINFNTSFIDGSVVYGSDEERATWLRTFKNGKLKTSSGDLLPYNTIDGEITSEIDPNAPGMDGDGDGTIKIFVAGDVRASENTILTSIQTIFVREHNRICDELVRGGYTDDNEIYQITRKQIGATIQSITYNEYLPSLGIILNTYRGYNDLVSPNILNSFATASYRIGHTMVSDDVVVVNNDCEETGPGEYELIETFFNPTLFVQHPVEVWLKGATVHELYQTDTKINDVLRNFLFGDPSSPVRFGIDLASLNIQRGRDHGIPDYNTLRKHYTGRAASTYSEISSTDSIATGLKTLYPNINTIDAWVGILSEDLMENKSVGNTMHEMLKEQFQNLRDGDYYYYENDEFLPLRLKKIIKNTTLSQLITRNSGATSLIDNVFFLDNCLPEEEFVVNELSKVTDLKLASVYPNQFDSFIIIDVIENYKQGNIEIYSLNGTLLLEHKLTGENSIQLNTSGLATGMYISKVILDKKINVLKIVK